METEAKSNAYKQKRGPGQAPRPRYIFKAPLLSQPRLLLLSHTLVQLLEKGRRRAQRLPRRQFTLRPGADRPRVVVGQRPVRPRLFLVLDHLLRAEQLPFVAQVLVELLSGVGQDRRQDRLEVVDDAQDDVDTGRRRLGILLDLEPGRLAVQG
jgi:hypothetical protein